MPREAIQLSGQTFGRWTVLRRAYDTPGKPVRWYCVCTCGDVGKVRTSKLLSGRSTGCEACKFEKFDITDQRFGRILVISQSHTQKRSSRWLCRCDCGRELVIARRELVAGRQSCGCLWRENVSRASTKHGLYNKHLSEYKTWTAMKQRCENPKEGSYHNYGARGIYVCDEWRDNFARFMRDMGPRPRGMWLERLDNDGPYAPWNCEWVTPVENLNNKRWSGIRPFLAP